MRLDVKTSPSAWLEVTTRSGFQRQCGKTIRCERSTMRMAPPVCPGTVAPFRGARLMGRSPERDLGPAVHPHEQPPTAGARRQQTPIADTQLPMTSNVRARVDSLGSVES